jgi:hypothetical protein
MCSFEWTIPPLGCVHRFIRAIDHTSLFRPLLVAARVFCITITF